MPLDMTMKPQPLVAPYGANLMASRNTTFSLTALASIAEFILFAIMGEARCVFFAAMPV